MIAVVDDRIDVVKLDAADAHGIQLDVVDDDYSIGGRRARPCTGAVVETKVARFATAHRYGRGARIDNEAHADPVDGAFGDEMAIAVGVERRRRTGRRGSAAVAPLAETEQLAFSVDLEFGGIGLRRQQPYTFRRRLADDQGG